MSKLSVVITSMRYLYVGLAFALVGNGFYNAYDKMRTEDVSTRQVYLTSEQRKYPSITFCYKYNHGTKRAIDNYLPRIYENAKSRECIMDLIETKGRVLLNLTEISNASVCTDHCRRHENCSIWTYKDGVCYMKNEKTFLIQTDSNRLFSGMKDCVGNDCIMYGVDHYGGDTDAVTANSHEECRKICNENSHCKRWTYQTSKNGACFLKDRLDGNDVKNYRPNKDVEICMKCKTGFRSSNNVKCSSMGILDNLPVDFSDMIPDRKVFLTNFTQRFKSEPFGVDVLRNDKNWKIFVPNENSGPCYTYTPPVDSDPGDTNSMYMVFNFTDWDPLLEIFIHDKTDFFYSKREMLNTKIITSKMLNETNTKYPRALVKISTQRKISTARMPCIKNPDYNFFKCAENYYSEKRGCQYPWNYDKQSNVTICNKYSQLSPLFWYWNQNVDTGAGRENFKLSEILLEKRKHCPPPCFLKKYSVGFEKWAWFSEAKPVSLQIALDGFTIYHEEEFYKCDSTCILGELGGNLGFFLGGSILLGLDIIFNGIRRISDKQVFKSI